MYQIWTMKLENSTVSVPRKHYKVVLEKGEDGWIVAKCLDVDGAISQGKNREEALRNIIEAIFAILEDRFEEVPEFSITWEERS